MTTTPPEAPPPPRPIGDTGPRVDGEQVRDLGRLRRSRTDRRVAGVAGGLARHLDVDPLVLRVAFVVLVFFGGAGLILYGAAWLLVPDDGAAKAPFHLDERSRSVALVIVGVIAALALIGDSWGAFWFPWPVAIVALVALWLLTRTQSSGQRAGYVPPAAPAAPAAPEAPGAAPSSPSPADQYSSWPTTASTGWIPPSTGAYAAPPAYVRPPHPRKRGPILFWFTIALIALAEGVLGIADVAGAPVAAPAYPALAVAICGLVLVAGAFFGRAGGIIAVGLVAVLGLAATTAAQEIDADSVTERPTTAAEVESDYSLGVGDQRIDFSRITDLAALDGRTISVEADAGSIDITVPVDARVRVVAHVRGPGQVKLFGADRSAWDVEDTATVGDPADPSITLDVALGVGTIEVTR